MKQLDGETMLEMQKQQDRLSKENLKKIMIQALADASGLPNQHLKALSHKTKMEAISEVAKKQLNDIGVGDDEVDEFRSVVGENLLDRSRLDSEKKSRSAQAAATMLSQSAGQSPIGLDAVGVQAQQEVANKATGMTPLRDDEMTTYHEARYNAVMHRNAELEQELHKIRTYEKGLKEREAHRDRQQSMASSSSVRMIPKSLGNTFEEVGKGIWNMLAPSSTPQSQGAKSEPQSRTPPQGSRSRDKSRSPRQEVKSEVKSEISSIHAKQESRASGSPAMAQPVGGTPLSHTPSGVASRSPSFEIGSVVPASSMKSGQSAITVRSSSASGSGSRSRSKSQAWRGAVGPYEKKKK
jgi:hypothetical protein